MATFIIVRHGSNAANQSMQFRKVLGTIEAADSQEAKEKASERWDCYNGQYFEAINLAGRTRKADREEAADEDAASGALAGGEEAWNAYLERCGE